MGSSSHRQKARAALEFLTRHGYLLSAEETTLKSGDSGFKVMIKGDDTERILSNYNLRLLYIGVVMGYKKGTEDVHYCD